MFTHAKLHVKSIFMIGLVVLGLTLLPGCVWRLSQSGLPKTTIFEAEDAGHAIGRGVEDSTSSRNKAWLAANESGMLVDWAYHYPAPGRYKAVFRLKSSDTATDKQIIRLSVVYGNLTNAGHPVLLAQRSIRTTDFALPDKYQDFALSFQSAQAMDHQYQVEVSGENCWIWCDYVKIVPLTPTRRDK